MGFTVTIALLETVTHRGVSHHLLVRISKGYQRRKEIDDIPLGEKRLTVNPGGGTERASFLRQQSLLSKGMRKNENE
jgi:hypothetical protein